MSEKVTAFDAWGGKVRSEFWFKGRVVGRADWYQNGNPGLVVGLRNGRPDGYLIEYHEKGAVSYAALITSNGGGAHHNFVHVHFG